MEEHPDFPIEEIERANLALEKASFIAWRRHSHKVNTWKEIEFKQLTMVSEPYTQLDGDVHSILSNGKSQVEYLIEMKHQLSFEPVGDFYEIVVSEKWCGKSEGAGNYPRLAYIVGLPLENCLYYCHTLKGKIDNKMRKPKKIGGGKVKIKIHKSHFVKIDKHYARKDIATWEFRVRNGVMLYGERQNYFPKADPALSDIDKLIMAKKIEVGRIEAEIAELSEYKRLQEKWAGKLGD